MRVKHGKLSVSLLVTLFLALFGPLRPVSAQAQEPAEPDDNTKAMYYSLYYEDYKNENYQSALPNLRWILQNAPTYGGPGRITDVNFERGTEIYDALAKGSSDAAVARAYLDTALVLFDKAVPTVKDAGGEVDEFQWLLAKGRFIQSHPEKLADVQDQVIPLYRKVYEMDASRLNPYYIQIIVLDEAKQDPNSALTMMDEMETKFADNAEVQTFITQLRDQLKGSMTPEARITFLEGELAKDPTNVGIMQELVSEYKRAGQRDKVYDLLERQNSANPSPAITRELAKMYQEDGDAAKAFELYEQLLATSGVQPVPEDYYNMGRAQAEMGSLAKARTYYRQALEVDPSYGQAWIAIGDLYVNAVSNCGSNEPTDFAVYWLAVDMYNRARNADPSVANMANQRISTYRGYFPSTEDKFFKGWTDGQSYPVNYGCYSWVGETTTVK